MKRFLIDELIDWKERGTKPLLLQGARQVGKTWLLKEFGRVHFKNIAYFNFEKSPDLESIFKGDLDPKKIVEKLSLYQGKKIDAEQCLIFFDEIQMCPRAMSSLKYFCEEGSYFRVVSAGSLLGVKVGKESSFPVGKVHFLTLYPMSFHEYLHAEKYEILSDYIFNKNDFESLDEANHTRLLELYKQYLVIGGMPEVVNTYIDTRDFQAVREVQADVLQAYERDFSKYTTKAEAIRITKTWNSIPRQLSKENKKFKYSDVEKGGRASAFEGTIEWLKNAGLIYVAYSVAKPLVPLNGYFELDKFKMFMFDTGLLGAMLQVPSKMIVDDDALFSQYNGAFIESYTAGELMIQGVGQLAYWTSGNSAEVDFIIQNDNTIFPLEVKSGQSRNLKSLRSYQTKYNPDCIVRTSQRNYTRNAEFINIPLYAVSECKRMLSLL
ncbi:MAG: ATP-binding protein [Fibrobacterales bacterium]